MEPLKPDRRLPEHIGSVPEHIGSVPKTPSNSWDEVTVQNMMDRNGPKLLRIKVADGWLYATENKFNGDTALVFIRDQFLSE